jgi:hypothetical protein
MDSPRLELSNGILFVKFRRRLSSFPFLVCFLLKTRASREVIRTRGEGMSFCPCGTRSQ